jgi:hypothetical protein
MRYTMDLHMMLTKPTPTHLFDAGNRMKICRLLDKYVTRLYGTRTVSTWFTKNKGKTIFDLVTMSDIAYTVAVIENGHDKWDESKNGSDGDEESPKKPKFTKRGGIKGQYTTTGWSQEGIEFYNKVWEEWKQLSGSNKFGVWEKMESEWFDYVEETGVGGNQGRRKKHKSNLEDKDVDHPIPDLPCEAAEMVFFGDEEYQPDCPWKNSGVERAIGDALDEWDFTDSSMEGDMIQNSVSLEGNGNENCD